tara:strand:- start:2176 stop:4860 length:2685 start_codon:yes stop_codon:yes gene_type:complete
MSKEANKALARKKIREYFPGINEAGIRSIMANIQAETNFKNTSLIENKFSWKTIRKHGPDGIGDWIKINERVDKWAIANGYVKDDGTVDEKKAKAAYDKLTKAQSNSVKYYGTEDDLAGGFGALQITAADTLKGRRESILKIAEEQGFTQEEFVDELEKGNYELGLDLSLAYYSKYQRIPWTVEMLNQSTPYSLRYTKGYGVNPYENYEAAKHVQSAFAKWGQNTALSEKDQTLSNDLNDAKKLTSLHTTLKTANFSVPEDDQEAFKKKIDNVSKVFDSDIKNGTFKGDDDELREEYYKRIGEAFGWNDVDIYSEQAVGEMRGQIELFYNYAMNEDYGIKIGGGGLFEIDSQFKDMTEDTNVSIEGLYNYPASVKDPEKIGKPRFAVPQTGKLPDKLMVQIKSNPILADMVVTRTSGSGSVKSGSFKGRETTEFSFDDVKLDDYLAKNYPEIREQYKDGDISIEEVIDGLSSQATHTNITRDESDDTQSQATNFDSVPIEDSDIFTSEEKTSLINVDYEEDEVVTEEENIEGFYRDGKFYPYAKVEEGDTDEMTTEGLVEEGQSDEISQEGSQAGKTEISEDEIDPNTGDTYYDLRGEGAFEESFLDKMGGLSSLIGLATGAIGLGAALKDVDIPKDPKLGPAFQQRLAESKRMAQQGLTPSELAQAHNDLDSSYAAGIENIVRGSAGNRAQFLAGLGGLDVARKSALMDIAVADAQMQRENQEKYDSMMLMNEQYEAARQAKYQDAKFQQDTARQAAGAALVGNSIAMVSDAIGNRHINRYNKMQSEKLMMQMGYKANKKGKSDQKQVGTDDEGNKMQTSFSLFDKKDEGPKFNLLDADDQAINTNINNQAKNQNTGTNLINTSPLNASSGLINTDNEINLGTQMYDIFNTGY